MDVTYTDVRHHLWRKGNLEWKLWEQQKPIHETIKNLPTTAQTIVLLCARQFGKSTTGCILALEDCLQNPGIIVMIVAPEIKHARSIVNPRMRLLTRDAPEGLVSFIKSEDRWIVGKSEIILGGFDIKNSSRLRGNTLHKVYVEEIVDSDPDSYRESIRSDISPALTHSSNAQIIYLTTLPKIPDHPFITSTIPEAQLNGAYFMYTINDNKKLTPEQYQKCVDMAGGINSVEFRREYLCEMVRDQSITVIPHFTKEHIENFALPNACRFYVSVDFGGVRDKTAALLHTFDFFNNRHLILDERIFDANTSTDEIVEGLREMEYGYEIEQRISDAPGQLIVDLNETHGYQVIMPHKTDWKAAVNQMAVAFSLNQIAIHPRCRFLIQSCRSGTFNKHKTDFERSSTLGHCDALAALMYAVRSQNKDNPYGDKTSQIVDNFWVPLPKDDILEQQFKSFGARKRFGVFQ